MNTILEAEIKPREMVDVGVYGVGATKIKASLICSTNYLCPRGL